MSINISKHNRSYTVITNEIIEDNNLNWDELGLLVYLLSKPKNWKTNASHLSKIRGVGINKIYKLLKKLRELGYADYRRGSDGKTSWDIFDSPRNSDPRDDLHCEANHHVLVSTDLLTSTIKDNNPLSPPQGEKTINQKKVKKNVSIPFQKIVDCYNTTLKDNPGSLILTDKRKRQIKKIWEFDKQHQTIEWWKDFFVFVKSSLFLTNQITNETHSTFKVDLEWLTNFNNFGKIIEGKYHR